MPEIAATFAEGVTHLGDGTVAIVRETVDDERDATRAITFVTNLLVIRTVKLTRTAFHRADLMDYDAFEQWELNGSQDSIARANAKWKQMLAAYEAPALDAHKEEELLNFMNERKKEAGF